jgi:hypothetical protein
MEIGDMFVSWIENSIRYITERFPLRLFALLVVGLTVASFAGGRATASLNFTVSLIAGTVLVFHFRLCDDLADRRYDQTHSPGRVLSRAERLHWFYQLLALSTLACLALLLILGHKPLVFAGLNAAALIWYAAVPIQWRQSIPGRHVLLLKYPIFVWLIAPQPHRGEIRLSMTIVYLCCAIYELFHDGGMRAKRAARMVMALEICLLGGIAVWIGASI